MKEEIKNIDIIPAIFLNYREDGNALLKCLQGDSTVNRAFEPIMIKGIKNPKYLLIGVITGVGMMRLNITDASDYEKLFKEKWNKLLK